MHYLLFYEVGEDYVARRAEYREAHLAKAWEASERGELVLGGALADPVDGAVLLFRSDSPRIAEEFAKTDPYVTSGLVKRWHVREWKTVAGDDAATPVRSKAPAREGAVDGERAISPSHATLHLSRIARIWKAKTSPVKFPEYMEHLTKKVFPSLQLIQGHRGAYLLKRASGDGIDITVMTLWESMQAVKQFAGPNPEAAVVEPTARAVLEHFDDFVQHFDVIYSAGE
jgi:uncharacterized protein YciI/heme-degrading monooxygenase HmoA